MLTGLRTPGSRSSEFLVTVVTVVVQVIMALADGPTGGTANKAGVAAAIAYVLSRGLAKYEGRGTVPPPVTPPVAPPQG